MTNSVYAFEIRADVEACLIDEGVEPSTVKVITIRYDHYEGFSDVLVVLSDGAMYSCLCGMAGKLSKFKKVEVSK